MSPVRGSCLVCCAFLLLLPVVTMRAAPLAVDTVAWGDRSSSSTIVTSSTFNTHAANELLLAFVASGGRYSRTTVTGVTGAGLTWALVARTNVQSGTAEIWRAFAPGLLAGVSVRATLSQNVPASITVVSFVGADPSGSLGAGAIGAVGSANAASGAPSASLVTTRNGSWVFGVGNDCNRATARAIGPDQTMVHQYLATYPADTYWVQRQNSATPLAGTQVPISDTAPSSDQYNLTLVEILPSPGGTLPAYSIAGTITPTAGGAGATVTLSGAASATTTADASGAYSFVNLADGSYTVTPAKSGYSFSPASRAVTVSGSNLTGVDFTAAAQAWSIAGTITPTAGGAGATVSLSGAASATTTADASGAYSFVNLANGSYTVTPAKSGYSFSPASRAVTLDGANATSIDFTATAVATGSLAMDAAVFVDRSTASTTLTTGTFSTSTGNELLLAFVSSDAASTGVKVTGVSGAGLTWVLAVRTNTQMGTAEIWRTFSPAGLRNVSVTATLSQSVAASMTVISFTGVETSGAYGSGAVGAIASASASSGAPSASLITTRDGSWVFGVGTDWDHAVARTVGPNQTIVHQYLASVGDTYWVQRQNNPTPVGGTRVTINDTSPTGDRYDLSLVEVLPTAGTVIPGYTILGAITPAADGAGATVALTGASSRSVTTDASGNYSLGAVSDGNYTITPSKSGYTFTPAVRSVTVNGADVTGADFTATSSLSGNMVVDATVTFQTMDGLGANLNARSWSDGGNNGAWLEWLVNTGGLSNVRLAKDRLDWVDSAGATTPSATLAALQLKDAATLDAVYGASAPDPEINDLWNSIAKLNALGVSGDHLTVSFMGWTSAWMSQTGPDCSSGHPGSGAAYGISWVCDHDAMATMIASLVYYGRVVKGLDFNLVSPFNEWNWNGLEGPYLTNANGSATGADWADIVSRTITKMSAMDASLANVKFTCCDAAHDTGYGALFNDAAANSTVAPRLLAHSGHAYTANTSATTGMGSDSYHGWLTETAVAECTNCDQGGDPSVSEWQYGKDQFDLAFNDIVAGWQSVLYWEATDGFWYHHQYDYAGNGWSRWGMMGCSFYNASQGGMPYCTGSLTPRLRGYALATLYRAVQPGMQRVQISAPAGVTAVAFYNSAQQRLGVSGHNTAGSSVTVNGWLSAITVPGGVLQLYFTNAGMELLRQADVALSGNSFSFSVPADTLFLLTTPAAGP